MASKYLIADWDYAYAKLAARTSIVWGLECHRCGVELGSHASHPPTCATGEDFLPLPKDAHLFAGTCYAPASIPEAPTFMVGGYARRTKESFTGGAGIGSIMYITAIGAHTVIGNVESSIGVQQWGKRYCEPIDAPFKVGDRARVVRDAPGGPSMAALKDYGVTSGIGVIVSLRASGVYEMRFDQYPRDSWDTIQLAQLESLETPATALQDAKRISERTLRRVACLTPGACPKCAGAMPCGYHG